MAYGSKRVDELMPQQRRTRMTSPSRILADAFNKAEAEHKRVLDKAKSDLDIHNTLTRETVNELKKAFEETQQFLIQKGFFFAYHARELSGVVSSDDSNLRIAIRVYGDEFFVKLPNRNDETRFGDINSMMEEIGNILAKYYLTKEV
jgi:hypothetical protein